MSRLPAHVAVIMDGNGRWAQKKGLMRLLGHREGYRTLKNVLLQASELGIRYLTVYGFSAENWRRPESEVGGLMRLIEDAAKTELRSLIENNVRVYVSGRLDELPATLQRALRSLVTSTETNTGIGFTLAINYGGRAEIVDAVKKLIASGAGPDDVDEAAIAGNLYVPDVPEPDLMVRTAGEMRWSNFLMWQSAYTELFVTDRTWPEFGAEELLDAVSAYQRRFRKFGGLGDGPEPV
ncbi:MAG: di-trans,poly-cis-decaprenylcistransferase [Armatimonadetes bacterium]|nr:di-trans,poly-cis-decaprenylcistransferase [Armatimonadota bacterium]